MLYFFFSEVWAGGAGAKIKKSENHFSLLGFVD
jgi:hypothetical protein